MYGQLKFGEVVTKVDLTAKIVTEKQAGVKTFYHFCGRPLPMYKPS